MAGLGCSLSFCLKATPLGISLHQAVQSPPTEGREEGEFRGHQGRSHPHHCKAGWKPGVSAGSAGAQEVSLAPAVTGARRCGIAETTQSVGHLGKATQGHAESGEMGQEAAECPGTGVERCLYRFFPQMDPRRQGAYWAGTQSLRGCWLAFSPLTHPP